MSALSSSSKQYPFTGAVGLYGAAIVTTCGVVIISYRRLKRSNGKSIMPSDAHINDGTTTAVILHRFDPQKHSPYSNKSISPFGIKVECFLRMCGIPYITPPFSVGALLSNPKRKLPTCEINDGTGNMITVPDSTIILKFLKNHSEYGNICKQKLCDDELTSTQRATGVAIKALCEDQIYWIVGYWRYAWAPGYAKYRTINTTVQDLLLPSPFRWILEKLAFQGVLNQIYAQGMSRHSQEEVDIIGQEAIDAVDSFLSASPTNKFLFGDKPSTFDATLFATLSSIVEIPIDSPLQKYTLQKPSITKYIELINDLFWSKKGNMKGNKPSNGPATEFWPDPHVSRIFTNDGSPGSDFSVVLVTLWPPPLNSIADQYNKFISQVQRCFDPSDLAQQGNGMPNVYLYPPEHIHITVATMHRFDVPTSPLERETLSREWSKIVRYAVSNHKSWPDSKGGKKLRLQVKRAQIGEKAGILLWDDKSGLIQQIRKCLFDVVDEKKDELKRAGIDPKMLSIPPIIHSTFLRFASKNLNSNGVRVQELFAETVLPNLKNTVGGQEVEHDTIRLVCERTPYMHIPCDSEHVFETIQL